MKVSVKGMPSTSNLRTLSLIRAVGPKLVRCRGTWKILDISVVLPTPLSPTHITFNRRPRTSNRFSCCFSSPSLSLISFTVALFGPVRTVGASSLQLSKSNQGKSCEGISFGWPVVIEGTQAKSKMPSASADQVLKHCMVLAGHPRHPNGGM
eukprot:2543565-Rhodomonas_salina.2